MNNSSLAFANKAAPGHVGPSLLRRHRARGRPRRGETLGARRLGGGAGGRGFAGWEAPSRQSGSEDPFLPLGLTGVQLAPRELPAPGVPGTAGTAGPGGPGGPRHRRNRRPRTFAAAFGQNWKCPALTRGGGGRRTCYPSAKQQSSDGCRSWR